MLSAITTYMPRWLMAIIATALVLATVVGSSQNTAQAIDPADTDTVYIADGTNFADALMGATIASLNTSPMLGVAGTNSGDVIPGDTVAELDRLTNDKTDLLDTIYVFGGTSAVSSSVFEQLGQWADDVQRIEGDSRWGTYQAISQMLPSAVDEAVHAQEADHATTADSATEADNADTLDGNDSTDFANAPETTTGTYRCIGPDFVTDSGTTYHHEVDFSLTTNDNDFFRCPLHLPEGATITAFRFDAVDDSANGELSSIDVAAREVTTATSSTEIIASVPDTGTAATNGEHFLQEDTSPADTPATIVNDSYGYVIDFFVDTSDATRVGVNWAEVEYEVPAVPGTVAP